MSKECEHKIIFVELRNINGNFHKAYRCTECNYEFIQEPDKKETAEFNS